VLATPPCPVHLAGKQVADRAGHTVYRDPGYRAFSSEVRCSGRTVWVVFHGGVASNQEAYVGVRSADGGRTWRVVFSEAYFGVRAPHELDAYSGPWTLDGPRRAYFTGWCPACGGGRGTVSLWATRNGGRTISRYRLHSLTGFRPAAVKVVGNLVTVTGRRFVPGLPRTRRATVEIR
jgi:hypothetical protein